MTIARHKLGLAGIGALIALTMAGCGDQQAQQAPNGAGNEAANATGNTTVDNAVDSVAGSTPAATSVVTGTVEKAVAVLHPTQDTNVRGTVTFTKEADGVRIVADITGLKPGLHGFHAHQNGDCSAPDASSAGGHFNPTDMPHSAPHDAKRHAGDFGNLTADDSGRARYNQLDTMVSLEGPNSVIGRAVIVHADEDDLKSQPSGDAGGRQSCGVIGVAG